MRHQPERRAAARLQRELTDAKRHSPKALGWTEIGPSRLVKVVRAGTIMNVPSSARAVGFTTQEKFLIGMTPNEIERALGLRPFSLLRGCRIFRLARLPQPSEFIDELTADMPDGLAFNVADALEAREQYVKDPNLTEVPFFPPGSSTIPQWRVTVAIPLIRLFDLPPLFAYPRPD